MMVKFTRSASGHFVMLVLVTIYLVTLISGLNISKEMYTYTDYNDTKHEVPIEPVYSISQLHKGDHIAFKRLNGFYWHHAIVAVSYTHLTLPTKLEV